MVVESSQDSAISSIVEEDCIACSEPNPTNLVCGTCNVFLCRDHLDLALTKKNCKSHTKLDHAKVCSSCKSYGHFRSSSGDCLKRKIRASRKDKTDAKGRGEDIEMFTRKNYLNSVLNPQLSPQGNLFS